MHKQKIIYSYPLFVLNGRLNIMPWQFQSVPWTARLRLDLHAAVHKALMLQRKNFFEAFKTGLKHRRFRTACPLETHLELAR